MKKLTVLLLLFTVSTSLSVEAAGDRIIVSNGVYELSGTITMMSPITIEGVTGNREDVIVDGGGTYRVFNVTVDDVMISGLTITNGRSDNNNKHGAGICFSSKNSIATNCMIIENEAVEMGGGVYEGTLIDCVIVGNEADDGGGGAYSSNLDGCVISNNVSLQSGGGLRSCDSINCTISSNSALKIGGGVFGGNSTNCIIFNNVSRDNIGGVVSGEVVNCVIVSNRSLSPTFAGGIDSPTIRNTVVYDNTPFDIESGSVLYNCVTNTPMFVDLANMNFRLAVGSPCINAGDNQFVNDLPIDMARNPRIHDCTVDIGAYEFYIPFAWIEEYYSNNLDVNPMDYAANNRYTIFQAYVANTDPTNSGSFFKIGNSELTTNGFVVNWNSAPGRVYSIDSGTNLLDGFINLATNLAYPQSSYTDETANAAGFYKVKVKVKPICSE